MKKLIASIALLAVSAGVAHAENFVCNVNHTAQQAIIMDNNDHFVVYNLDFQPLYRSAELRLTKGDTRFRAGERQGLIFRAYDQGMPVFDIKDTATRQEYFFNNCSVIPHTEEEIEAEGEIAGSAAEMVGAIGVNDNAGSYTGEVWSDSGDVTGHVKIIRDANKTLTVTFDDGSVTKYVVTTGDAKEGTYFISRNHLELYTAKGTIMVGGTKISK